MGGHIWPSLCLVSVRLPFVGLFKVLVLVAHCSFLMAFKALQGIPFGVVAGGRASLFMRYLSHSGQDANTH